MAETFLAVQHGVAGFEQRVCIKFMLPALRNDPGFRQMFLREATIAASLRHANIVGVVDVDEQEGYIVLELVDGVDLRTLVNAAPNRRLPAHVVSLIAIELCKALAYAHGRTRRGLPDGIVHRDISPSNVLVSHNGEVKLTDFGVAKAMRGATEPSSTGIKGKLCYMSPEQTRGEHLDARSDLFSLGIMLYELLAGARPFDGPNDAQTLMRIETGRHRSLVDIAPDVPPGLALVIERMLRVDIEHRYPSADACIDALSRFGPPVTTFRELGRLARSARPPVTLSSAEFGLATPDSGSHVLPRQDQTKRSPVAPPPAAAEPERPELTRESPRTLPMSLPVTAEMPRPVPAPRVVPAHDRASPPSRLVRVSRGAWMALGTSLSIAAFVLIAWIARWGNAVANPPPALRPPSAAAATPPPALPAAPPAPSAAPPALPVTPASPAAPRAAGASVPRETSPLVRPDVPDRRDPELPGTRELAPTVRDVDSEPPERRTRIAAATAEAKAELRVGTVPLGQVWIDGEAAGWAPVVVNLPPGLHTVAGGNTSPEVTRQVRLRAGEKKRLVLSLEDDGLGADTTAPTANR